MRLRLLLLSSLVLTLPGNAGAAPPRGHVRCGTLERLAQAVRTPRPARTFTLGGEKQTRDGFGGGHEELLSTNFAVKWTSANLTPDQAQQVLDILEDSWSLYFDTLGHTIPAGADQFRINAYVSGEKDNPSIDFDGGYANLDGEGFTYLVLSTNLIGQADDDGLLATASHEFYHDVQFGTEAYIGESAYWYWEATAEWASQQLYPDLDDSYAFVGAFALLTELPIFFSGDAFAEDPSGVHQYGASIFPRHLTDRLDSPALVADSWEQALPEDDPLDVLDGLLPSGTIAEAYAEFAPHMALWDFTRRDLIVPWVDLYADAYPDDDAIALRIGPEGTGGLVSAPAGRQPHSFGANVIEIARPASGELDLSVEVDAAGSLGTPGQLTATVVRPVPGTADVDYTPVAIVGGAGAAHLELAADQPIAYLVVAATADTRSFDESFPYRVGVEPVVPQPEPQPDDGEPDDGSSPADGDEDGGCGCRSGGAPANAGSAALLLLGVALSRRRHDRRR
jgi:MYXO-CTERM domain-containing protein